MVEREVVKGGVHLPVVPRVHEKVSPLASEEGVEPATNVRKALLAALRGGRGLESPLSLDVGGDVSAILRPPFASEISQEELRFLRRGLTNLLGLQAEHMRGFLQSLVAKRGSRFAVRALSDVGVFSDVVASEGLHSIRLGENKRYWMQDMLADDVARLHDGVHPVRVWDFGAATGEVAASIRGELGGTASVDITDLTYMPHHPVDGVHFQPAEVASKNQVGGVDIAVAQHSLRYCILPHIAARNILALTNRKAYLTFEDYTGVNAASLAFSETDPDFSRSYLGYWGFRGESIESCVDPLVRRELAAAEEEGFRVRVLSRNDILDGRSRFRPVTSLHEKDYVRRIIAERE